MHLLDVLFGVAKVVLPLLDIHGFLHVDQVVVQRFGLLLKHSHFSCVQQIEALLHVLDLLGDVFVAARWLPVADYVLDAGEAFLERIQLDEGPVVFFGGIDNALNCFEN